MPRQRIHVQIDGLLSIHAVRAARMALGALPGVETVEVSMRGAVLDTLWPVSREDVNAALALVGQQVIGWRTETGRLPVVFPPPVDAES